MPRRAGRADRADFAERFELAADFLAGLLDCFFATDFLVTRFVAVCFFAGRFLVAITYLPQDFRATAQLDRAPTGALELLRFQPSQKATA